MSATFPEPPNPVDLPRPRASSLRVLLRSTLGFVAGFGVTLLAVACIDPEARSTLDSTTSSRSRSTSSSIPGSTASSNSMASDGARGACLAYDVTSPTRPNCINCFDSLLQANCTGSFATDPDPVQEQYCPDRVFRDGFTSQLNLCIQNAILAGFSCNLTCSNGLELDPSNCLCITPASVSTATGDPYVDVGAENFGAPVVSVIWPAGGPEQIRTISSPTPPNPMATSCSVALTATDPLYMIVRNRGDTSLDGNLYANPTVSSSPGSSISIQAAVAPLPLSGLGGFTNPPPGSNVYATFKVVTDNYKHLAPDNPGPLYHGGSPDLLFVLTGIPQAEPLIAPTATPSPVFSNASAATNAIIQRGAPVHIARTSGGNLIFSEINGATLSGTTATYNFAIRILCLRNTDWCTTLGVGGDLNVHTIAGGSATGDSFGTTTCAAGGTVGTLQITALRNLTALTVDSQGNIVFGSHGTGYTSVGLICRNTSGVCSGLVINAGCGATSATGSNTTAHLVAINTAVATSMAGGDLFAHRIRGLAVHGTNIYFTLKDGSSAGIKAICRSIDTIGCTGGAGTYNSTVISGMTNALGPAGIAIDSAHNILFWSQTGDGTVHGYCPSNTCGTTHGPSPIPITTLTALNTPIAGTGAVGYSGDGGSARAASLANPIQLILSRTHDGATSTSSTSLHDHNLIIVEGAKQTTGGTVTGNAIRILCGNSNNTGPTETFDPGFCQGRTPGTIHRIAGTPNRIGHAMNTGMPLSTSFANLTSATFDPYKNLVVSSSAGFAGLTSDGTNNQWFVDHALYTILNNATVGVSGAKYSFEDSAGKKSLYCLRVTAKQSCSWRFDGTDLIENCICSMEPGLPSGGQVFDGTTIDTSCP